jgi:hypothetical protein
MGISKSDSGEFPVFLDSALCLSGAGVAADVGVVDTYFMLAVWYQTTAFLTSLHPLHGIFLLSDDK